MSAIITDSWPGGYFFQIEGTLWLTNINERFIFITMKEKPYMTLTEAAELLAVTRQRVHAIIREGRLEVIDTIGGHRLILLDRKQVERLKRERDKAKN